MLVPAAAATAAADRNNADTVVRILLTYTDNQTDELCLLKIMRSLGAN